jgi:hypothetical protein
VANPDLSADELKRLQKPARGSAILARAKADADRKAKEREVAAMSAPVMSAAAGRKRTSAEAGHWKPRTCTTSRCEGRPPRKTK